MKTLQKVHVFTVLSSATIIWFWWLAHWHTHVHTW